MIISCFANDAHLAYIYIRGEMPDGAKLLNKALAEARAKISLAKTFWAALQSWKFTFTAARRLHLRRGNRPHRIT